MRLLNVFKRMLLFFALKKLKKPPSKVAYLRRILVVSEIFHNTALQPKWHNSCSKMWPIEQLYIELGSQSNRATQTLTTVRATVIWIVKNCPKNLILSENISWASNHPSQIHFSVKKTCFFFIKLASFGLFYLMNYKKNLALSNFYSKRGAHHLKTYLSTVRATVVKQEPQMHIWAMGIRFFSSN